MTFFCHKFDLFHTFVRQINYIIMDDGPYCKRIKQLY